MNLRIYGVLILTLAFVHQVSGARSETGSDPNRVRCERAGEPRLCATPLKKLPEEVAAYVKGMTDLCRQVKGEPLSAPTVEHGRFAAGLEFWTINEGTLQCKGAESLYSGSHGSGVAVYVSAPNGQAKEAFVQGAYGVTIEHTGDYAKIWIAVAGQLCGQQGDPSTAELVFCERALSWNIEGQKLDFAPLSEARIPVHFGNQVVELRQRPIERNADATTPLFFQPAIHNGSQMRLSEWRNGIVEITYDVPRPGLPVTKGGLLFRGVKTGARYSGTAYTFKAGCPPAPYPVTGVEDERREIIVLNGAAPHRDMRSCDVVGQTSRSANTKLVFDIHIDGDE